MRRSDRQLGEVEARGILARGAPLNRRGVGLRSAG
jgi:hypothetical protein